MGWFAVHIENLYSRYGYRVFRVCVSSPCPGDEALKVLVAIPMRWLHVVSWRAERGAGKQIGTTTRKNADSGEGPNPPGRPMDSV